MVRMIDWLNVDKFSGICKIYCKEKKNVGLMDCKYKSLIIA